MQGRAHAGRSPELSRPGRPAFRGPGRPARRRFRALRARWALDTAKTARAPPDRARACRARRAPAQGGQGLAKETKERKEKKERRKRSSPAASRALRNIGTSITLLSWDEVCGFGLLEILPWSVSTPATASLSLFQCLRVAGKLAESRRHRVADAVRCQEPAAQYPV